MKFRNMIFVFSLMLLQASVFPTLAKPPEIAKIVFTSNRDGNQEFTSWISILLGEVPFLKIGEILSMR